jgi:indole-3-acetate monooxygenase
MRELIQRLEKLAPAIAGRRDEIERARRLPRDLVDALRDTGLFSLEIPRALGGREATPLEILEALELVARADGSTGWCVSQALVCNGASAFMSEAGAEEVVADPRAPTAGIFAPTGAAVRVDGGVKVSGRWKFASGIHHSQWLMAGCLIMENGQPRMTPLGPEAIHVFVPVKSIEIHDTWQVSGLCGTGSHDVSAKDVFVPASRVFLVGDPARCRREPICRMPVLGWFVAHVAAVSLGIARSALDEATQVAQKRVPTFTMTALAEQPVAQVELARAEGALAAARALLRESVGDLWRVVSSGEQPTLRQIALARIAALNAAEVGAAVTRSASQLGGGGAIFVSSALQRHTRDAEAITHHFSVAPNVWEDAGRVFMGRKPNAPLF